jgi:hypothetical protein
VNLASLQGHWRRNWLRASGFADTTTRVHWMQAGQWCADIRVPLVRPLRDATSLATLSGPDLAVLLAAEGFAGHVTLSGDVCTWTRTWNWRGFPCAVDAGKLTFDAVDLLIEDGVHADYREEWQRVPGDPWQAFAVEADLGSGMLLTNDRGYVLGLGQQNAAAWPLLASALESGEAHPAEVADAFRSIYVMGHWDGAAGIADLSTQPFCEGHAVLARDKDTLTLPDFHGDRRTHRLRLTPLPTD